MLNKRSLRAQWLSIDGLWGVVYAGKAIECSNDPLLEHVAILPL